MTPPFWRNLDDLSSKYENTGSPRIAKRLKSEGKCAFRIRLQNQTARIIVSSHFCSARLGRPDKVAQIAAAKFPIIKTNSAERKTAKPRGDGNSIAKFFVQPSSSCTQLRYIRVRTASPP